MTDTQIKSYFTAKKKADVGLKKKVDIAQSSSYSDKAELVSVDADETILRNFDMETNFGPCVGLSRLERWNRAEKFGLDPPRNVRDLIISHPNDKKYTECLWYAYESLR